jgi:hypothetical protein
MQQGSPQGEPGAMVPPPGDGNFRMMPKRERSPVGNVYEESTQAPMRNMQ